MRIVISSQIADCQEELVLLLALVEKAALRNRGTEDLEDECTLRTAWGCHISPPPLSVSSLPSHTCTLMTLLCLMSERYGASLPMSNHHHGAVWGEVSRRPLEGLLEVWETWALLYLHLRRRENF